MADYTSSNTGAAIDGAVDYVELLDNIVTVDSGNNRIGINNGSPASALDVTGSVTADGLTVDTDTLVVDATNNRVGIGTSSIEGRLHVYNGASGKSYAVDGADQLILENNSSVLMDIRTPADATGGILFSDANARGRGVIQYSHSTDAMYFNTAGASAMTIDASGNLGIGTSDPQKTLDVKGTFAISNSTTSYWDFDRDDSDGALKIADTGTERMTIDSSGTTTFTKSGGGNIRIAETASRYAEIFGYAEGTANGSTMAFHTIESGTSTSTERMRLDASGNLLVSGTSLTEDNHWHTKDGTCYSYRASGVGRVHNQFFNAGSLRGEITSSAGGATLFTSISDSRVKENITDAADAGSTIDALQVRQFDMIGGAHHDYGMVAQELALVCPDSVYQPEDSEKMMSVDYSKLVPMLVKEIQSLRARIAALES